MTTLYAALKLLHVGCAVVSVSGFALRGYWALAGSALLRRRAVRILPHVVDTLFLLSGIALAVLIRQSPVSQPWLTAKIVGLVAYILLGSLTLKYARTMASRFVVFVLALVTFAWIASVALSRNPLGFLARAAWVQIT